MDTITADTPAVDLGSFWSSSLHRERQAYGNNVLSERFRATPLNGRDARTAWCSFLLDELGVNCKLEYLGPGMRCTFRKVFGTSSSPSLGRWL